MKPIFLMSLLALLIGACANSTQPETVSVTGSWKLIAYGASSNPTPALPAVETELQLDDAGAMYGSVGCNRLSSTYTIANDGALVFGAVMSTRKYCEGIMEQEYGVIQILSNNQLDVSAERNQMKMTTKDGSLVIILEQK